MKASKFFTDKEKKEIEEAIKMAEKMTSGEIRVHVDTICKADDVRDCAVRVFAKLGMHKTKLRNGVLIYLSIEDSRFAIIGDSGINAVVPPDFWDKIKDTMVEYFKDKRFTEGIIQGIMMIGEKLNLYFPLEYGDKNELSNKISF
jgi:uncharacterized membrane protein